jgi:hypothetical protein
MNSLSAHLCQRRAAVVAICGLLIAAAAVPVALAAAPKPKIGYYKSGKGQRYVAFSVAKTHRKYKITGFPIQCFVNDNSLGAIQLSGPTSVLANGSFF